jgi:RNA polymerase sigma-70 factor, ECF subfamily
MLAMEDLYRRFRDGDPEAVRAVYDRHGGAVMTVARSIVGDGEMANDVVQTTFIKAWRAAATFQGERELAPWLYAIARRTAIDALRHERRPTRGDHVGLIDGVDVVDTSASFERTWEAHEVRRALDDLPADEREVIRRSHLLGEPHQHIADELGIPVGTVKSRSSRAHRRLAAALSHLTATSEPGTSQPGSAEPDPRPAGANRSAPADVLPDEDPR